VTTAPARVPTPPRLRDDRDFVRFWSALAVSVVGTAITWVALPILMYAESGSPFLTGLVAAFEALPYVLFGLFAGAIGDRLDRKRLMIGTDLAGAVVVGSIPLAAWFGELTVAHLLAVAFLGPLLFVFHDAAEFGGLPRLVGRDRIAAANSAVFSAGHTAELVVPPLAGAALAVVSGASLLALDALSFLVAALLLRTVQAPLSDPDRPRERLNATSLLADVREGVRWLWAHPGVRTMTLVGTTQSVAGGAFVGQVVPWADQQLGVVQGDPRLGVVLGAWGVGSLVAAAAVPRIVRRIGAARTALYALPASAVLAVLAPLAPSWQAGALLLLVWAAAYMAVVLNSVTYRQRVTPDALMSRVNTAGRTLAWGLGWPVGAVLGGAVAEASTPATGMLAGAGFVVAGAMLAWFSPLRTTSATA